MEQSALKNARRVVVKVGSALLTNDGRGLDRQMIENLASQICSLVHDGKEVVFVSSGAIAEGVLRLGWSKRPERICELQAAAAVGQMGLVQAYETAFSAHGVKTAQILLTHADLSNRERYLNAREALLELLRLGVVPIINENDTVVTVRALSLPMDGKRTFCRVWHRAKRSARSLPPCRRLGTHAPTGWPTNCGLRG